MIGHDLARRLKEAGLRWTPASGDRFILDVGADLGSDVFTVSDMTVDVHRFETGTVLGFNGTTEWALDSVELMDALWLPREDQLRELLGAGFIRLEAVQAGYRVDATILGRQRRFEAETADDAYAAAVLELISLALA
ncbi:pilus assembly protein CpaE [Spelaeicoccus albus]|uniref:Pilus assembly protein CpaE n=1 Tax=Spelaeicoccus albus TaxID=1280376 RepID=A0A7Z0A978_9MICO|nr:pilus assembly protein CpaE [Spelaeicoccus albus]NYI65880.1 hypothetical protein [Spelaeicoccus albus]